MTKKNHAKSAKKRAAAKKEKAARAERNTIKREAKGLPPLKDPARLEWIRQQPCLISTILGEKQEGPTEAAHVGDRGLGRKCPDSQTIPLSRKYHTQGPLSHHRLGKSFWAVWRLDREETIRRFQKLYAAHVRKLKQKE